MSAGLIHWRREWGLFWPNYDAAPERTHAYVLKHLVDVDMTIAAARRHRLCIQAGGHVGLWPLKLAEHFDLVLTFEPDPALFECLRKNTAKAPNIRCFSSALGTHPGMAYLRPHRKAGSWSIVDYDDATDTDVRVAVETIDGVLSEYSADRCDALVLDIEGAEVEALRGAAQTITEHRPVIHVEELGPHRRRSAAHMRSIGYVERRRAGHDALYTFGGDHADH